MSLKQKISIIRFILKTVYFSPSNNPAVFLLGIMATIFITTGSIGKHEAVLVMMIIGISNRLMPAFIKRPANDGETCGITISQYCRLLPIKESVFFTGYFITGLLYATILSVCLLLVGIKNENPPVIPSITPVKTVTTINTVSNEPVTSVSGVIFMPYGKDHFQPVQFAIPVKSSIIFGNISSMVIIGNDKVHDSVLADLYPENQESHRNDISLLPGKNNAYYSDLLKSLPQKHSRILLFIMLLCLIVFFFDLIKIYGFSEKSPGMIKFAEYLVFSSYFCLCIALICDLILPESIINRITSLLTNYSSYISTGYYSAICVGICSVLYFIYSQVK